MFKRIGGRCKSLKNNTLTHWIDLIVDIGLVAFDVLSAYSNCIRF